MNPAAIVALLGIASAVAWGIADIFSAKSARSVGPILGATVVNILAVILFVIIFGLFFRSHTHLTTLGFWFAAAAGIFLAIGFACFFVGLKAGPVSIVSPLSSTYPLVTTAMALFVFNARLTSRELLGIILTVCGIVAASGLLSLKKSDRQLTKGPIFALLTALSWGFAYVFVAQSIKRIDWQLTSLIENGFIVLTFLALVPVIKGNEVISLQTIKHGLANKFVIAAAIISTAGAVAIDIGISRSTATSGAVVTAISASYPILTIFLALRIFKEKERLIPLVGAFVGIVGVIVLSLG